MTDELIARVDGLDAPDAAIVAEVCRAVGAEPPADTSALRQSLKAAFPDKAVHTIYRYGQDCMWGGRIGTVERWHHNPDVALLSAAIHAR